MRKILSLKKDVKQLKKAGKMIGEKSPFFAEMVKSALVIIKWVIIIGVILVMIVAIYEALNYSSPSSLLGPPPPKKEEVEKKEEKKYQTLPAFFHELEWSVEKIYNHGKIIKDSNIFHDNKTTEGKFVEIVIVVKNESLSSTVKLPAITTELKDDKGRIYEKIYLGFSLHYDTSKENLCSYPIDVKGICNATFMKNISCEVKPNIPYKFSLFYEVASDSEKFSISIK